MSKPFYITTPIYYPSGNPHIGHCYTTLACDALARMKRMQGYEVMFLTGTDEHGQKIEKKAKEQGVSPKEYIDPIVDNFKSLWKTMDISYDRYIRTTDDYHIESVQKIFKELYDRGYIYKSSYEGKYCDPCESFWTESQLIDGKCPDCGREVHDEKEEAYFFKLSEFAPRIEKLLTETDFLQPHSRVAEMVNNFIKPGLQDLCVSRTSLKWGIPVTFDTKHVVYVWIDALSNYITALGYDNEKYDDFAKYWPADIHMMAKEIVRFHTIIWPAILMALDLPLPKKVYVHGWITFNGAKMSKSLGNVIDPFVLCNRYGVDALRYHLLREMPFGADAAFSNETMINRFNADLSNDLGNLVSRTVAMVLKYFDGTLPYEREALEIDDNLIDMATSLKSKTSELFDSCQFSIALIEIFKVISRANKYIDENSPWVLAKDESKKARLATVLYNLLDTIRIISILIYPVMPNTSPKINEQIGAKSSDVTWENADKFNILANDVTVKKGDVLFPRIDVEKEILELNKLIKPAEEQKEEIKLNSEITIDDFAKVELRVALVKSVEKVAKSDKLLCLQLDDGMGGRQVVSGIAQWYTPDDLVGKKIIVVANLKPVKLRGVMSNGMIIAADAADGSAKVVFPDQNLPVGAKIR